MHNLKIELSSLEKTESVARKISEHLFKGAVILLWGDMGSGKTTFIKSLCSGLGVRPNKVTSPTYTLVNIYKCKWFIYHVDLFRINAPEQLYDMDRADMIADEGVTMVEWPQMLQNYLTDEPVINLRFSAISEHHRHLILDTESNDFDILFDSMEQQILSRVIS